MIGRTGREHSKTDLAVHHPGPNIHGGGVGVDFGSDSFVDIDSWLFGWLLCLSPSESSFVFNKTVIFACVSVFNPP